MLLSLHLRPSRLVIRATAVAIAATVLIPDAGHAATCGSPASSVMTNGSARSGVANRAAAIARAQIGKPYIRGGSGPSGFDCSGLVQYSYRRAGVSIPRTTFAQVSAGRRVSLANLRPGDLVFYYSGTHVAMYIGGGKVVHASRPGRPITVAPLHSMPFMAAVRVT